MYSYMVYGSRCSPFFTCLRPYFWCGDGLTCGDAKSNRRQCFVFVWISFGVGGDPIGYFDWSMIQQGALSGIESIALFGAVASAMDFCFDKKLISKFP